MSKLERLLVPGTTETPDCPCGSEMRICKSEPAERTRDAEVRVYVCAACGRELRLMVWAESVAPGGSIVGM
jgi:hypothetical protein